MVDGEALGKLPHALQKRHEDVVLTDGTTVRVLKWSWLKYKDLIKLIGNIDNTPQIAEASVDAKDRERVKVLDPEDLMALAKAAIELNMTPGCLKNLGGLLRAGEGLLEAVETKRAQ